MDRFVRVGGAAITKFLAELAKTAQEFWLTLLASVSLPVKHR